MNRKWDDINYYMRMGIMLAILWLVFLFAVLLDMLWHLIFGGI